MGNIASNKKIKELLNKVVDSKKFFSKQCTVKEVDADNFTCDCDPIDGGPTYFDVMLSPTANATNVSIPNVGSTVFISFLDEDNAYVSSMDSVATSIVRSTDENAEHHTSLKETLNTFADGMNDLMNKMTFNTPQGPSSPGILPPVKTELQQLVDDFKEKIDTLFKE